MAAFSLIYKRVILFVSIVLFGFSVSAQKDSLSIKKCSLVGISNLTVLTSGYIGLNQLWYKDYPQSSLHWFNDANEWMQIDKMGHAYSAYWLSDVFESQFKFCGFTSKKSAVFGTSLGFISMSMIELLDAQSAQWGASASDLLANGMGSLLFLSQALIFKEQIARLKFSYHATPYANLNPQLLGSTNIERLIKDYNGQSYWLSVNLSKSLNLEKLPPYISISFGNGADGMFRANQSDNSLASRRWMLSLDWDLTQIKTKKKWLKSLLSLINVVKLPFPTLVYQQNKFDFYYLYF
ncbi:MAG: DUF2279 domain-containing protein [Bacteroidales bacterium]|nr:DUF2279 domain-containing protein [Bacteroidales bacterium]